MLFNTKIIYYNKRYCGIVLQGSNGPCPIIALANILSLRGLISITTHTDRNNRITHQTIINLVADTILKRIHQQESMAVIQAAVVAAGPPPLPGSVMSSQGGKGAGGSGSNTPTIRITGGSRGGSKNNRTAGGSGGCGSDISNNASFNSAYQHQLLRPFAPGGNTGYAGAPSSRPMSSATPSVDSDLNLIGQHQQQQHSTPFSPNSWNQNMFPSPGSANAPHGGPGLPPRSPVKNNMSHFPVPLQQIQMQLNRSLSQHSSADGTMQHANSRPDRLHVDPASLHSFEAIGPHESNPSSNTAEILTSPPLPSTMGGANDTISPPHSAAATIAPTGTLGSEGDDTPLMRGDTLLSPMSVQHHRQAGSFGGSADSTHTTHTAVPATSTLPHPYDGDTQATGATRGAETISPPEVEGAGPMIESLNGTVTAVTDPLAATTATPILNDAIAENKSRPSKRGNGVEYGTAGGQLSPSAGDAATSSSLTHRQASAYLTNTLSTLSEGSLSQRLPTIPFIEREESNLLGRGAEANATPSSNQAESNSPAQSNVVHSPSDPSPNREQVQRTRSSREHSIEGRNASQTPASPAVHPPPLSSPSASSTPSAAGHREQSGPTSPFTRIDPTNAASNRAQFLEFQQQQQQLQQHSAHSSHKRRTSHTTTSSSAGVTAAETLTLDALEALPQLLEGMTLNVRFKSIDGFESSKALSVIAALGVRLVHGWLIDEQDVKLAKEVGNRSYNELMDMMVNEFADTMRDTQNRNAVSEDNTLSEKAKESGTDVELVEVGGHPELSNSNAGEVREDMAPISPIELKRRFESKIFNSKSNNNDSSSNKATSQMGNAFGRADDMVDQFYSTKLPFFQHFLETTPTQLSTVGLFSLVEGIEEQELCMFFRNNHFSVITKRDKRLLELVSDEGVAGALNKNVGWQTLQDVEGSMTNYVCTDPEPSSSKVPTPTSSLNLGTGAHGSGAPPSSSWNWGWGERGGGGHGTTRANFNTSSSKRSSASSAAHPPRPEAELLYESIPATGTINPYFIQEGKTSPAQTSGNATIHQGTVVRQPSSRRRQEQQRAESARQVDDGNACSLM